MAKQVFLSDLDEIFRKTKFPIIVNELPYITKEDRVAFNNILMTQFDSDVLNNVPTCVCGALTGGSEKNKDVCPKCNTQVTLPSEVDIDLSTWIRVPDGIDCFMLPFIYKKLSRIMNRTGFNIIDWLIDPSLIPPSNTSKETRKRLKVFEDTGYERNINSFRINFDKILDTFNVMTKYKREEFFNFLKQNKKLVFPKYLALPSKAMIIIENTHVGSFADTDTITGAIEAARTIASICSPRLRPYSKKQIYVKVASIISNISKYYFNTIKGPFCEKKGYIRGQIFSSRGLFCMRAVITSSYKPHCYATVKVPWAQGVEIFKVHLVSKLFHRGMNPNEAYAYVESIGNQYDPTIHELLKEIIAEGYPIQYILNNDLMLDLYTAFGYHGESLDQFRMPVNGFPSVMQRNPSLDRLSGQFFYIDEVKSDIKDKTISLSPLGLKGFNADFDGDEMHLFLIMLDELVAQAKMASPHYGIHDSTHLGKLRNVSNLPETTVASIYNFLNSED